MEVHRLSLDQAIDLTRTGDVWLFRGSSMADRAIQVTTNAPVNHVGMAVAIDDLPPLMWHAELGRSLVDMWTGTHHRGVQLHDLRDAVVVWATKYGQRAWLRQLDHHVSREEEDAVLRCIARLDGTPFPSTARLAARWMRGRRPVRRLALRRPLRAGVDAAAAADPAPDGGSSSIAGDLESAFCAEVVAVSYAAMGLLPGGRPPNWYDPGRFWSGDDLSLQLGARLGAEIEVDVPVGTQRSTA